MEVAGDLFRFRNVSPTSFARCQRLIERTKSAIPFEHILITGLDADGLRAGSGMLLLSSFPAPYLETYFSEGYLSLDPIIPLALSSNRPVTDGEAWHDKKPGARYRGLRDLMRYYGIRKRTVAPVSRSGRTYGTIVVTSPRTLTDAEQEYLQFVAEPLHTISSEPFADEVRSNLRLTTGEIRSLVLASRGLTSEAIAHQSAYAVETVNSYLKSATKKLGCSNRTEAVAEAVRRRLIS